MRTSPNESLPTRPSGLAGRGVRARHRNRGQDEGGRDRWARRSNAAAAVEAKRSSRGWRPAQPASLVREPRSRELRFSFARASVGGSRSRGRHGGSPLRGPSRFRVGVQRRRPSPALHVGRGGGFRAKAARRTADGRRHKRGSLGIAARFDRDAPGRHDRLPAMASSSATPTTLTWIQAGDRQIRNG